MVFSCFIVDEIETELHVGTMHSLNVHPITSSLNIKWNPPSNSTFRWYSYLQK